MTETGAGVSWTRSSTNPEAAQQPLELALASFASGEHAEHRQVDELAEVRFVAVREHELD